MDRRRVLRNVAAGGALALGVPVAAADSTDVEELHVTIRQDGETIDARLVDLDAELQREIVGSSVGTRDLEDDCCYVRCRSECDYCAPSCSDYDHCIWKVDC